MLTTGFVKKYNCLLTVTVNSTILYRLYMLFFPSASPSWAAKVWSATGFLQQQLPERLPPEEECCHAVVAELGNLAFWGTPTYLDGLSAAGGLGLSSSFVAPKVILPCVLTHVQGDHGATWELIRGYATVGSAEVPSWGGNLMLWRNRDTNPQEGISWK